MRKYTISGHTVTLIHSLVKPNVMDYITGFLPTNMIGHWKASECFDRFYSHGGGWNKFEGFTMAEDFMSISYSGDQPQKALAELMFGEERIILYAWSWVAIVQVDGSYEIARID
ncbi:MAG: hypothetical protein ACRDBG_23510 [Waterburya sp.]